MKLLAFSLITLHVAVMLARLQLNRIEERQEEYQRRLVIELSVTHHHMLDLEMRFRAMERECHK